MEKGMEKRDKEGFVDAALRKATSRKLLVFLISTTLLFLGKLTPDLWAYISLVYIGSQGLADIFATVKKR